MTIPKTLAWHGDPQLKARAVDRMRIHREQDRFVQGCYLARGNELSQTIGCFLGCLVAEDIARNEGISLVDLVYQQVYLPGFWWQQSEWHFGIDRRAAEILDAVYEAQISTEAAGTFAVEATEAIPVGADLSSFATEWNGLRDVSLDDDPRYVTDLVVKLLASAPVPGGAS